MQRTSLATLLLVHLCGAPAMAGECARIGPLDAFAKWAEGAFAHPVKSDEPGRPLVLRMDRVRADKLQLAVASAGARVFITAEGAAGFAVPAEVFVGTLLRCVRLAGLGAGDAVTVTGLDAGFVARRWRIPHHAVAGRQDASAARRELIARIERLTEQGALGVPAGGRLDAADRAGGGLETAFHNTVAMIINAAAYANVRSGARIRADSRHLLDAGGGTLVRVRSRLVVVTAAHIVPRGTRSGAILAVAHDGIVFPLELLLHGGRVFDVAVFGFTDDDQERQALAAYGGVDVAGETVANGAFVFHIGFPDGWQTDRPLADAGAGPIDVAGVSRPLSVLTSGLVADVGTGRLRISCRLSPGDSGGGVFTISAAGAPLLLGPASTVRSEGDGNPPAGEVARPVTGSVFRFHLFDLVRTMPLYFRPVRE